MFADNAQRRAALALRCGVHEIAEARRAEAEHLRRVSTEPAPDAVAVPPPVESGTNAVADRPTGERRWNRIPDELAAQIREANARGEKYRDIAMRFNVSEGVIARALKRPA